MKDKIKVLRKINKNPGINQRTLSAKCKISLGKINSIVDILEKDQTIIKEVRGRQYKYNITQRGLVILENTLKSDKEICLELHSKNKASIRKAVILAAGKNKNFNKPVCNLKLNNATLIERNINILKDNGIE